MTATHDDLKAVIPEASRWYVRLQAGDLGESERAAWQAWMDRAESHRQAWQLVEGLRAQLGQLPAHLAASTLKGAELSRRQMLRRLGSLALAAPLGLAVWQLAPWQALPRWRILSPWQAQYATAIGEQQRIALPDGSLLTLNTATAVDTLFDGQARRIRLYRGEILVETAADPQTPARPFYVDTPQGRIQALGTRFTVRIAGDVSQVTVLEKTVRLFPAKSSGSLDLHPGQQARFTRTHTEPLPALAHGTWWTGSLVVVDMPLRALLAELSRYRAGSLTCADGIAALKISGAFPLKDTDRALAAITRSFPVRAQRLTPWWVRLVAEEAFARPL